MARPSTTVMRTRVVTLAAAIVSLGVALLWAPTAVADKPPAPARTTVEVYDDFGSGYSLADYQEKWSNPYGLGEMALGDTRSFARGAFNVSAVPFRTGADFSVFDHLNYIAISNKAFPVPTSGSLEISSTIKASTEAARRSR